MPIERIKQPVFVIEVYYFIPSANCTKTEGAIGWFVGLVTVQLGVNAVQVLPPRKCRREDRLLLFMRMPNACDDI